MTAVLMELQRYVLPIAAALFAAFVLFQFRPKTSERRALLHRIRDAKTRAKGSESPIERARHLTEAAEAAAEAGRARTAQWMFLRAARTAPTDAAILDRAAAALGRKPRLLEALLWRRLGASFGGDAEADVRIAASRQLAVLYAGPLRDAGKAKVLDRLASLESRARTS